MYNYYIEELKELRRLFNSLEAMSDSNNDGISSDLAIKGIDRVDNMIKTMRENRDD